jgi:amino acid permease
MNIAQFSRIFRIVSMILLSFLFLTHSLAFGSDNGSAHSSISSVFLPTLNFALFLFFVAYVAKPIFKNLWSERENRYRKVFNQAQLQLAEAHTIKP